MEFAVKCAAIKPPNSICDNAESARLGYETPETARKRGDAFRLRREVEAMNFVQSHTSIPIPRILDMQLGTSRDGEQSWILMKRLPGSQLGEAWPLMNARAQAHMICQLKSYLEQLRPLQPPERGWIGSCSKGPAYDHRLDNMSTCGPFSVCRRIS